MKYLEEYQAFMSQHVPMLLMAVFLFIGVLAILWPVIWPNAQDKRSQRLQDQFGGIDGMSEVLNPSGVKPKAAPNQPREAIVIEPVWEGEHESANGAILRELRINGKLLYKRDKLGRWRNPKGYFADPKDDVTIQVLCQQEVWNAI